MSQGTVTAAAAALVLLLLPPRRRQGLCCREWKRLPTNHTGKSSFSSSLFRIRVPCRGGEAAGGGGACRLLRPARWPVCKPGSREDAARGPAAGPRGSVGGAEDPRNAHQADPSGAAHRVRATGLPLPRAVASVPLPLPLPLALPFRIGRWWRSPPCLNGAFPRATPNRLFLGNSALEEESCCPCPSCRMVVHLKSDADAARAAAHYAGPDPRAPVPGLLCLRAGAAAGAASSSSAGGAAGGPVPPTNAFELLMRSAGGAGKPAAAAAQSPPPIKPRGGWSQALQRIAADPGSSPGVIEVAQEFVVVLVGTLLVSLGGYRGVQEARGA